MNLLAFDTSTEAFSVAISQHGSVTESFYIPEKKHTQILLETIQSELRKVELSLADLDALVYGRGPGAFTGVRLAVAAAQGLGFSVDLPVIGISSLAAVAQSVYTETGENKVLVGLDARMAELYYAAYEFYGSGEMRCVIDEQVCAPNALPQPEADSWVAAGTAWQVYRDQLPTDLIAQVKIIEENIYPSAKAMLALAEVKLHQGQTTAPAAAVPVYLRNNVAQKPKVPV